MQLPAHQPLVVATRGNAVESVHYGSVAVADAEGRLILGIGDPEFPVFTRSTLKPFQALPFVAGGGPAHFGFGAEQVALICASHSGEPRHVAAVAAMLARIGCHESDLQCGIHPPIFYAVAGCAPPPGLHSGPLHHNCSGKHAGFLAWCRQHDQPTADYLAPEHPLQREIRRALASVSTCDIAALPCGTDGCSAPNYALPLVRLAQAYARLAAGDSAAGEIFAAMTAHPEMVSGSGRADLALMRARPGDLLAKGGAEGMQAMAIRSRGLGIAIKIADGAARAVLAATAAVLEQLDLLPDSDETLRPWLGEAIINNAGRVTGHIRPVFRLD